MIRSMLRHPMHDDMLATTKTHKNIGELMVYLNTLRAQYGLDQRVHISVDDLSINRFETGFFNPKDENKIDIYKFEIGGLVGFLDENIQEVKISPLQYPLELENIGGDSYLVISRGHHDLQLFKEKVLEEYAGFGNFFTDAYHCYYKATPRDGYSAWYTPCSSHVRGAFPVTVAQEGWKAKA